MAIVIINIVIVIHVAATAAAACFRFSAVGVSDLGLIFLLFIYCYSALCFSPSHETKGPPPIRQLPRAVHCYQRTSAKE